MLCHSGSNCVIMEGSRCFLGPSTGSCHTPYRIGGQVSPCLGLSLYLARYDLVTCGFKRFVFVEREMCNCVRPDPENIGKWQGWTHGVIMSGSS